MPNQRTRQKKKEAAAAAAEAKKEAAKPKAAAKPAPVPTPPGGRQRGVCRWFVDKKKYGFISSGDGRDIFVHGADLKEAIGEGDTVEYAVVDFKGRPKAIEVTKISGKEPPKPPQPPTPPPSPPQIMQPPPALPAPVARPPPPKPQGPPPRRRGVCQWFTPKKKHGFIKPDGAGADVFVHQMDLRAGTEITEGDTVEFGTADYKGREKAVDVIKVDPAQYAESTAFLNAVLCLSQRLPVQTNIPDDQIVSAAADTCFAAARISQATQTAIYECRTGQSTGGVSGEQLLRDSFGVVDTRRIGESPTIFFSAPGLEQDEGTLELLKSQGLTPSSEVLYCGDRVPAAILDGSCHALQTLQDGSALPQEMLVNLHECPQTGVDSEPGCVDNNVEMGATSAMFLETFGPIVILCGICALPCCRSQRLCPGSRRLSPAGGAAGAAGQRPQRTVSRGLSASAISRIPTFVVDDGLNSTCTICFEPVCDGETSFSLRCSHRHHVECLTDWVARKAECPDCRGAISARELAASDRSSRGGNRTSSSSGSGGLSVGLTDDVTDDLPPPPPPPGPPPLLEDDPDDPGAGPTRTANPLN